MGLARLFGGGMGLGSVRINRLGDCGGPVSSRVEAELDALVAWAKDGVREIGRDFSVVGNVGTGLDNLHSYSLPANSLATNGDWIRVTSFGLFGNNDDNKRVVFTFGGQTVEDTGLIDFDTNGWKAVAEYGRLSSTSVIASFVATFGQMQFDSAGGTFSGVGCRVVARGGPLTGLSNLNSNATTILVQGESATATNDNVTQRLTIVELRQQ